MGSPVRTRDRYCCRPREQSIWEVRRAEGDLRRHWSSRRRLADGVRVSRETTTGGRLHPFVWDRAASRAAEGDYRGRGADRRRLRGPRQSGENRMRTVGSAATASCDRPGGVRSAWCPRSTSLTPSHVPLLHGMRCRRELVEGIGMSQNGDRNIRRRRENVYRPFGSGELQRRWLERAGSLFHQSGVQCWSLYVTVSH